MDIRGWLSPVSSLSFGLSISLLWWSAPPWKNAFFNWGSVVLEITGGAIVLWQLSEMSQKFSNVGILQGAFNWLKRSPLWSRPKSIELEVQDAISTSTGNKLSLKVGWGNQTLEQKVDFLFEEVQRLDDGANKVRRELLENINKVKSEVSKLNELLQTVKTELQNAMVGDVRLEVFGALIIAQGVIMGAMVNF